MTENKGVKRQKNRERAAAFLALGLPLLFLFLLLLPGSRTVILDGSDRSPFLMAFVKFSLLASAGEILAGRIRLGVFSFPRGGLLKALVWGLIGMLIALLLPVYQGGVQRAIADGLLPSLSTKVLPAFWVSLFLNATFGVVMMAGHRLSDTWIERWAERRSRPLEKREPLKAQAEQKALLEAVDWAAFIRSVVCRSLPLFWIPAHTLTFLLPASLRVIWSAFLSIALGLILAISGRSKET